MIVPVLELQPAGKHMVWFASHPDFIGICAMGETKEEASAQFRVNLIDYLNDMYGD
jgi:predicted RNase H-like HicB family nuclease